MPTSARKSSVGGARRAPTKYIPYRADDLQHGKKTGIAVEYVDHRSDEFEPFDKVMSQADQRTPPRVQNARKRRTPRPRTPRTPAVQEVDEDGEMSMELEDSIPNSPSAYFKHARAHTITNSVQRVGSSSRPVAHSSEVDFDKVPSPRESPALSHRRSLGLPRTSGLSHLSQSTVVQDDDDDEPADGGMDFDAPDFDGGGFASDDDDDIPPAQSSQASRHSQGRSSAHTSRRTSFAQMDQEDDDEEGQIEQLTDNEPTPKAKGKQRDTGHVSQRDEDIEDDISRGLAEVEQQPMDEEEDEDVPLRKRTGQDRGDDDSIEKYQRPNKKAKTENEGAKKPRGRPKGSNNVLRDVTPVDENTDGLRRGRRVRYKPLEWWRCEKVVYGRRETGTSFVPTIKEIHRIPKEEPQPLGAKHRRKRPPRSKTVDEAQGTLVYNPEEGWDEDTQAEAPILDWKSKDELVKRIAFTAKMVTPKAAANNDFYFQKIFGDADFIAAGELIIPPDGQKPTKSTKDNTFVFYVIEGAVNLTVHKTSFILASGGMFLVPRGNMYHIRNICERDARLFFAQARKVSDEEIEEDRRSVGPRKSRGSSGSAGPTTTIRSSSEPQSPAAAVGAAGTRRAAPSKAR